MVSYYSGSLGTTNVQVAGATTPTLPVYIGVDAWTPAVAGSSVKITVHLTCPASAGSSTMVACPAGVPIHANFTNTTAPLRSSYANETCDATGTCVFYLPGTFFSMADTYNLTIAVVPTVVGTTDYIAGDAGYAKTFAVTGVATTTYPTVTTLALLTGGSVSSPVATTVHPGDTLVLETVVTINQVGGTALSNATVNMVLTYADGTQTTFAVNTGTGGVNFYDLSSVLAAATATSKGFGTWSITGTFPGQTPSGLSPGFYASEDMIEMPGAFWQNGMVTDDPGFYYENGMLASYIHGAHGTPYLPGAADVEIGRPSNIYGMADPGDAYGADYWGAATSPPQYNDYQDPDNLFGTGIGNTYVDTNVTDRSGGVIDNTQEAQNPNFYRPNALIYGPSIPYGVPGYLGDPQFNNYGNSYVDTNVTDRSQSMVYGLQAEQNPNFYRNGMVTGYENSAQYYGPVAPDDVLTNPVYTMFANEPSGRYSEPADTQRKVCKTY